MAESDTIYQTLIGCVQLFPEQPSTIIEKEAGDQTVREFWIKSPNTQTTARVTVWPNVAPDLQLNPGDFVGIEAAIKVNGDFTNITARSVAVGLRALENGEDDRVAPAPKVKKKDVKF